MIRLDKYMCDLGIGSRNEVKNWIRKGMVIVDGEVAGKPEQKLDEQTAVLTFQGQEYSYVRHVYYMMNKPAGVITATSDARERTVLDLLREELAAQGIPLRPRISPVGRLDKDTEGLLLLTNDGALSHHLLSPRHHVAKTYEVHCAKPILREAVAQLKAGVDIGEESPTLPAEVTVLTDSVILLTIYEGKFHQVKRMMQAVDNEVVYLKRLQMGTLCLDESLKKGGIRPLTMEELHDLQ